MLDTRSKERTQDIGHIGDLLVFNLHRYFQTSTIKTRNFRKTKAQLYENFQTIKRSIKTMILLYLFNLLIYHII